MKASAYQEQGEEFMLRAVKCNKKESLYSLNKECSHKVYKSLRLAQSARTQLEKNCGRQYSILRREVSYGYWEPVMEF